MAPAWKRGSQPRTLLRAGQLLHPVGVPSRAARLRVLRRPVRLRHERPPDALPPAEQLPAGPPPVARLVGARIPVERPLDAPLLLEPPAAVPLVGARSPRAHSRSAELPGEQTLVEPTPVAQPVGAQLPVSRCRRAALPGGPPPCVHSQAARPPTTEPVVGPPRPEDRPRPVPWLGLAFRRPLPLAPMQRLPDLMRRMPRPTQLSERRRQGPPPTWPCRFAPRPSRSAAWEWLARPRWALQRATQLGRARQLAPHQLVAAARVRVRARTSIRPPRSIRSSK